MKFEQLGVIDFFGILIPGAYLTTFFILAFACILELSGLQGHAGIFSFMSQHSLPSSTAFFFVSYLFGVVIRLFAPGVIDRSSTLYLSYICWNKEEWVYDIFPYQKTLESSMDALGMAQVSDLIKSLNRRYGQHNNTRFFNYCKLIIEANNETVAKHIRENEALVRFLAGTAFALIASCIVGLSFSIVFFFTHQLLFFQLYVALTLASLATLAGILARFKYQRRREAQVLWTSMYLLLKGGIPNALGITPNELQKRVTLEMTQNTGSPGISNDNQTVE